MNKSKSGKAPKITKTTPQTVERRLGDYLNLLIYAHLKDRNNVNDGPPKTSIFTQQHYENLMKTGEDKATSLRNIFIMSDGVRQILACLCAKLIEEINIASIGESDSVEDIKRKTSEANADCFTLFMFDIYKRFKASFGPTLSTATDGGNWIHGYIVGCFPSHTTHTILCAVISTNFHGFLKSMAWLMGEMIWYNKVSVTAPLFLGMVAQQFMPDSMCEILLSALRPPKIKAKKPAASGVPASGVPASGVPASGVTVANGVASTNATSAHPDDEYQPLDDDDQSNEVDDLAGEFV